MVPNGRLDEGGMVNQASTPIFATTAEYAAHRGCDASLIRRWKAEGKLVVHDDGRIVVHATDAALKATLHPSRGGKRTAGQSAEAKNVGGAARAARGDARIDFGEEAAREKRAKADSAELDLAERAGLLVSTQTVRRNVRGLAVAAREALLGLPGRVSAELVALTDASAIEAVLLAELQLLCAQMAMAASHVDGSEANQ